MFVPLSHLSRLWVLLILLCKILQTLYRDLICAGSGCLLNLPVRLPRSFSVLGSVQTFVVLLTSDLPSRATPLQLTNGYSQIIYFYGVREGFAVPYFPSWKTCYRRIRDFHPVSQRTSMHSAKSFLPLPFGAHTKAILNKDFRAKLNRNARNKNQ